MGRYSETPIVSLIVCRKDERPCWDTALEITALLYYVAKAVHRRHMRRLAMQSPGINKHSIDLAGHKTSVSLEDEFWKSLRHIARGRGKTLTDLLVKIDADREYANLSSAIRLFVLRYYRDELDQRGGVIIPHGLHSNSIEAR
jgi:predicted DNA-binding ribbon-helix-helix protein